MLSWPLFKYVLTAALRDRLTMVLFLMVLVGTALSVFMGSSAITEANRFALVFAAGGLRLAGVAGIVLFIVFYVRRAFETRDVDFLLSRPLSRIAFICSHAAAFSFIALLVTALVVLAVTAMSSHHSMDGMGLWSLSLAVEFIIMANAALFFAMVLPSATAGAMASLSLYILARLMGEMLGIVYTGAYLPGFRIFAAAMKIISLIVPRLDLMAQTSWLVYGPVDNVVGAGFIFLQGLIYTALLVSAAMIDLLRRQF